MRVCTGRHRQRDLRSPGFAVSNAFSPASAVAGSPFRLAADRGIAMLPVGFERVGKGRTIVAARPGPCWR